MAFQTYGNPKPYNPLQQYAQPFAFDYAAYERAIEALIAPQPKPAETPKPKVSYEYVIRLDSGSRAVKLHGQYVEYNAAFGIPGFTRGRTLESATRFKTANDAAEALKKRNVANPGGAELFSLVPVKVTVTPATTSTKTVDEVVPGTNGFVLHVASGSMAGQYINFKQQQQPTPGGSANYTSDIALAHLFSTAAQAGEWLGLRASGVYRHYSGPVVMLPYSTPATTKPKTVTETIPASTTVVLA